MSDELLRICAAELFYEVSPQISPDALCAELQKRCGNVDKIKTGQDAYLFRCWARVLPLAYLAPPKADSSLRSE